jgi:hypothetical protein
MKEEEEEHYDEVDSASDESLQWVDAMRYWPGNDNRGKLFRRGSP